MKRIDFSVQKIDWRVVAVVAFNDDIDDLRIAKDKDKKFFTQIWLPEDADEQYVKQRRSLERTSYLLTDRWHSCNSWYD